MDWAPVLITAIHHVCPQLLRGSLMMGITGSAAAEELLQQAVCDGLGEFNVQKRSRRFVLRPE